MHHVTLLRPAVYTLFPYTTLFRSRIEDISTGGQKYLMQTDGSMLAQGYAPTKHTAIFWSTNDIKGVTAFQIELLNDGNRSEEHTSELQSRFDLVCRLLLEKKKLSL